MADFKSAARSEQQTSRLLFIRNRKRDVYDTLFLLASPYRLRQVGLIILR